MNRKYRRLLAAAALLILTAPGSLHAQEHSLDSHGGPLLSLEALLQEVRTQNPTLLSARLEAAALATRPRQVSALPDPSAGLSYRPFAVSGFDGIAPARLEVQQMIPYPGKLRLAGDAARFGAEMAAYDTDELLLELEYQVKESFYELFMIQQHEHHIRDFQSQLEDFEMAAASRYEVGEGMQQDILRAQLDRNFFTRRLLELAAMRREHLEHLARLVNRPDLVQERDQIVLERAPLDPPAALTPEMAVEGRAELKAIDAGIKMAEAEVAMAKREYLPDFMLGAGIMDMMPENGGVMPLTNLPQRFGIEFGLVIPLQRGRRDAALEEARLKRQAFDARREAVETEIRTEVNDLRYQLEQHAEALALYRDTLMPQAETTLEATMSAYTTGRADFLDLLDARKMILDVDMEYEHSYADYLKARARLERTAGMTTPDALTTTFDEAKQ